MPEGFADDYYTEVYVKFACDFPLYSEEYDAYIEQKQDAWEALTEDLAAERYQTVRSEAETKLADGKNSLQRKKRRQRASLMMQKTIRRCKKPDRRRRKAACRCKEKIGICPG